MSQHQSITAAFIEKVYAEESSVRGDAAERKRHAYSMMNDGCDLNTIQWWYDNSDSPTFKAAKRALDSAILSRQPLTFGDLPRFTEEPKYEVTDDDFADVD